MPGHRFPEHDSWALLYHNLLIISQLIILFARQFFCGRFSSAAFLRHSTPAGNLRRIGSMVMHAVLSGCVKRPPKWMERRFSERLRAQVHAIRLSCPAARIAGGACIRAKFRQQRFPAGGILVAPHIVDGLFQIFAEELLNPVERYLVEIVIQVGMVGAGDNQEFLVAAGQFCRCPR